MTIAPCSLAQVGLPLWLEYLLQNLCCCLEKKHLNCFTLGYKRVPEEMVLFLASEELAPFNLFQHLAKKPATLTSVLHEFEESWDGLTRRLALEEISADNLERLPHTELHVWNSQLVAEEDLLLPEGRSGYREQGEGRPRAAAHWEEKLCPPWDGLPTAVASDNSGWCCSQHSHQFLPCFPVSWTGVVRVAILPRAWHCPLSVAAQFLSKRHH